MGPVAPLLAGAIAVAAGPIPVHRLSVLGQLLVRHGLHVPCPSGGSAALLKGADVDDAVDGQGVRAKAAENWPVVQHRLDRVTTFLTRGGRRK